MKFKITGILLLCIINTVLGQGLDTFFSKADHFFSKNVTDGLVHYKAIKENPKELDELLSLMRSASVSKSDAKIFKAFYINAYNIATIKGIVDQYPVASPNDIPGFFDQKTHQIAGKDITLNNLENKMLRANFSQEPRFHFALVCAGLGCPPIINKAYKPATLDKQLTQQTKLAINNPKFTRYDASQGTLALSKIFEWYKEDFTKGQTLIDFVNTYRNESLPKNTKVTFYKYNWNLNDKK